MKRFLIIFTKEPEKGKVKTRLEGCLSRVACLNLYKAFLKDTIRIAEKIKCGGKFLFYAPTKKKPDFLMAATPSFLVYEQWGKDLGERMHSAFSSVAGKGSAKIVLIGSDAPTLPPRYINEAFSALDKKDVALGPCRDGGFYLIGLKKPCREIFQNVHWSSVLVLSETLKNTRRLKKKTAVLQEWYDVDEPEGLNNLKCELKNTKERNIAPWTRKFLKI